MKDTKKSGTRASGRGTHDPDPQNNQEPLVLGIQNEDVNEPFLPLGKMGLEDDSARKREAERKAKWAYAAMAVSALFSFGAGFCVKAIYEWY